MPELGILILTWWPLNFKLAKTSRPTSEHKPTEVKLTLPSRHWHNPCLPDKD